MAGLGNRQTAGRQAVDPRRHHPWLAIWSSIPRRSPSASRDLPAPSGARTDRRRRLRLCQLLDHLRGPSDRRVDQVGGIGGRRPPRDKGVMGLRCATDLTRHSRESGNPDCRSGTVVLGPRFWAVTEKWTGRWNRLFHAERQPLRRQQPGRQRASSPTSSTRRSMPRRSVSIPRGSASIISARSACCPAPIWCWPMSRPGRSASASRPRSPSCRCIIRSGSPSNGRRWTCSPAAASISPPAAAMTGASICR